MTHEWNHQKNAQYEKMLEGRIMNSFIYAGYIDIHL